MSCVGKDNCGSCFNWANSVLIARTLSTVSKTATIHQQTCANPITESVTDCKIYSGETITGTAAIAATDNTLATEAILGTELTVNHCLFCNTIWQNYNNTLTAELQTGATCSNSAFDSGCEMIDNCMQNICLHAIVETGADTG